MSYRLMHISDLHAGWHFDLQVAEQLVKQAHKLQPDLLVISGDLVLRADLVMQWRTICAYLHMLPQPQLVVPGNHDVSLFNGLYRLLFPLKRYRYYMTNDLNPIFTRPGLAVIGGCSAHGLTIDGGYLYKNQLSALDKALSNTAPDACKVVVLHHHIVDLPGEKKRRKIANVEQAIRLLDAHKVDLFLCGHMHVSHIGTTSDFLKDMHHPMVISQCGTTTSRRGRGTDHGKNSFHIITIDEDNIRVAPYFYQQGQNQFLSYSERVFPRNKQAV